jgi:hypothetical protein
MVGVDVREPCERRPCCYVHNVLVHNDAGKCSCTSHGTNMRNLNASDHVSRCPKQACVGAHLCSTAKSSAKLRRCFLRF